MVYLYNLLTITLCINFIFKGHIWETKVRNCNNFLHWAPFELLNEDQETNVFPRENAILRRYASNHGHTLEDSPLFQLVGMCLSSLPTRWYVSLISSNSLVCVSHLFQLVGMCLSSLPTHWYVSLISSSSFVCVSHLFQLVGMCLSSLPARLYVSHLFQLVCMSLISSNSLVCVSHLFQLVCMCLSSLPARLYVSINILFKFN